MNGASEEFWKQFIGSLARKVLVLIAGVLIAHLGLSETVVSYLTSDTTVAAVVGFVLLALGVLWTWAKTKFNINFINKAANAAPGTSIGVIKEAAKQESTFQSSI
jgi:hypothetical protein